MSKLTEASIAHLLRKKYGTNEWAFMCQVRNTTGDAHQSRYADALAFGLWPSRGLEILGFEIKVSRGDWKKECETPEKAEAIAQFCDRWWIVAPVGIARKEELPAGWGLMETEGSQLKVTKDAPKLEPKEPSRGFWCSVMRAFTEQVDVQAQIKVQVAIATEAARKEGEESSDSFHTSMLKTAEEKAKRAEQQARDASDELGEVLRNIGCSRQELRSLPLKEMVYVLREGRRLEMMLGNFQYVSSTLIDQLKQLQTEMLPAEKKGADE